MPVGSQHAIDYVTRNSQYSGGVSTFGAIAAGIGGSILGNAINYFSQKDANRQNRKMQEMQWAREDTALQRHVADAQAAGLSPLANVNGSPTSLNTSTVAPTVDVSTTADMFRSLGESMQRYAEKQIDVSENQKNRNFQDAIVTKQIEASMVELDKKISSQESIADKQISEHLRDSLATLQEMQFSNDRDNALKLTQFFADQVSAVTGGRSKNYYVCNDAKEYQSAISLWSSQYAKAVSRYISDMSSASESSSTTAGGSIGASIKGIGGSLSGNGSHSSSSGYTKSSRESDSLSAWLANNPMPVPGFRYKKTRKEN